MKLQFKVSVQNNFATAQLVINDNPEAFEALRVDAETIESHSQGRVEWHPVEESPDRSNRSRVAVTREVDLKNEDQWSEYHDWLLQRGTELHDAFSDRVRELSV
jgi:hypothetical protein